MTEECDYVREHGGKDKGLTFTFAYSTNFDTDDKTSTVLNHAVDNDGAYQQVDPARKSGHPIGS